MSAALWAGHAGPTRKARVSLQCAEALRAVHVLAAIRREDGRFNHRLETDSALVVFNSRVRINDAIRVRCMLHFREASLRASAGVSLHGVLHDSGGGQAAAPLLAAGALCLRCALCPLRLLSSESRSVDPTRTRFFLVFLQVGLACFVARCHRHAGARRRGVTHERAVLNSDCLPRGGNHPQVQPESQFARKCN